jgi:HEPN domain-containing protein
MGLGLKRADLQAIAEAKLADAVLLITNKRFSNAYYLSGYAIEIGLKACIAKQFTADVIPDKNFVIDIYKHNLKQLVGVAGLASALKQAEDRDPDFALNWAFAAQWTPESRYEVTDAVTAQVMVLAVSHANSGVFRWIKANW